MIASNFENVPMDLIYLIVLKVLVFRNSFFFNLRMEVINVLGDNTDLLVLTFKIFYYFRKSIVPLVWFGLGFYFVKVP